jgi:quercetin dioxygenase-like cupin family protein
MLRPLAKPVLLALAVAMLPACSRTWPETQYPPPGPSGGLPYTPLSLEQGEDEDEPDDADDEAPPAKPAAAPAATPIDAALPAAPPSVLERAASCSEKVCKLAGWLPDPAFARAAVGSGDPPVALWSHSIEKGSTLLVPRHSHLDLFGLVLGGKLLVAGDEGGAAQSLGPWHALRVPGGGVTLKAEGADTVLVLAIATDRDSLAAALGEKPALVRWKKRSGQIAWVDLAATRDLAWLGGAAHARIAFGGNASARASLEVLRFSGDAGVAEHDHPTWEHVGVLQGTGTLVLDGKRYPVAPGTVIHVPRTVRHAFEPGGSSEALIVQLYAPSGPEQRFEALAGVAPAEPTPAAVPAPPGGRPPSPPSGARALVPPPAPKRPPPGTARAE